MCWMTSLRILALTERDLQAVGVSAMTGQGMRDFFKAVEEAKNDYER